VYSMIIERILCLSFHEKGCEYGTGIMIMEDRKCSDTSLTEERIIKAVDNMKHNKDAGEEGLVSIYIKGSMHGEKRLL